MKKSKKIIIIIMLVICLISIFILLSLLKGEEQSEEAREELELEQDISNLTDNAFIEVDSYNIYYSVDNILNQYIGYLKNINGDEQFDWERLGISEEEAISAIKEEGTKSIYSALDEQYIESCNISENNIIAIAEELKQNGNYDENINYSLRIEEMYMAEISTDIVIVLVNANINDKDFNWIVKLDLQNSTYSMFGQEYIDEYNYSKDMDISNIDISTNSIENNEYNLFTYMDVTTDYIVTQYFSDFKDRMLNDTEYSYELINEEYREKKYGNYNNYENYVNNNYYEIQAASISKYLVNNYENYTEYVCVDQNGKYYIFREENMLKYNVILDTYTIDLQDFKDKYYAGDEQVKVGMNIEKIIEAVNTKDYSYVYNKMDETFRNNNFGSIESFEEYIRNNFYEYNEVEYTSFTNEGDTYIYTIEIKNAKDEGADIKNCTIIMKLLEDSNFVMSFNMG